MAKRSETDLYAPVKSWLEGLGFEVKGEVGAADVMAMRAGEEPVLVELKLGFSLALLAQAVARQALSDHVYVAVPRWQGRAGYRAFKSNLGLCRRLALGVLTVRLEDGLVELHHAPRPFQPRKNARRRDALIREFEARVGDPNLGGAAASAGRMTAYRQDALRCAVFLARAGEGSGAQIKREAGVARATAIMAANHYGWFVRLRRGVYGLSAAGLEAAGSPVAEVAAEVTEGAGGEGLAEAPAKAPVKTSAKTPAKARTNKAPAKAPNEAAVKTPKKARAKAAGKVRRPPAVPAERGD